MEEQQPNNEDQDVKDNKGITILSYIGILCLIPLLAKKDSRFAKFHAKQGLVILIGELFTWIPFVGWMLGIFLFVLSVMGIVNVLGGKYTKLPIVGDLAEKFNI